MEIDKGLFIVYNVLINLSSLIDSFIAKLN